MEKDPDDRPPPVPESIRRHRAAQAKGYREWTDDEKEVVRKLYPDYKALQAALPHRSYSALRSAAEKWADRSRRHVWTVPENAKLKRMWARSATNEELIEAFPGMDMNRIYAHANWMKLGPRAPGYVKFDAHVLHSIRQRAKEDGFTFVELDRLAKTGRYFQKSSRRITPQHVVKAMKALGGSWDIDWNREA